jgi:negative regulator of sigma-B (phosphoserine phosphatase)
VNSEAAVDERSSVLELGVASRPRAGETASGDEAVVAWLGEGALVAAVDGLGHGSAAAHAAASAAELLRRYATEPLGSLIERCHAELRTTRGVAMSVARFAFYDDTLAWAGVGNVEGRLVRPNSGRPVSEQLITARGAVGVQVLPQVRTTSLEVERGAMLLLATDGIDPAFADSVPGRGDADEIADRILRDHGKAADDALVVVARYRGRPG